MLEGHNICKRFGGLQALDGVSFHLGEGEILGLMGPNGAGKTTLFDVITGFLPPTSGSITFAGQRLAGMAPHAIVRRGVVRSFQHPRPFLDLTARRNVEAAMAFGADPPPGGPAAPQRYLASADAILEFVGLGPRAGVPAAQLTAVERKRLEVARVLACRPRAALLDEPLQGLNPAEARQAAELVRRIRNEFGIAVLIVEHNVRALGHICDRILVLNYGRKIADGPPQAVARDPEVIRAYLGEETMITGEETMLTEA